MPVVIGAEGAGVTTTSGIGNAGGNSTFAGITANGGSPGNYNYNGGPGAGGTVTGATYNTTGGSGLGSANNYDGGRGGNTNSEYSFVATNIGIGGAGARHNAANAEVLTTGYGQGGGGGASSSGQKNSASGRPGVLYVLRF